MTGSGKSKEEMRTMTKHTMLLVAMVGLLSLATADYAYAKG